MSTTKAGGSTKLGRDSNSKRLGVKAYGGQTVTAGSIIVRQRGSRYGAGSGTRTGKDYTIFAVEDGVVEFGKRIKKNFAGQSRPQTTVMIKAATQTTPKATVSSKAKV